MPERVPCPLSRHSPDGGDDCWRAVVSKAEPVANPGGYHVCCTFNKI